MSNYHVSVLLQEAIAYLNIQKGKKYIDATLGGGGHTAQILKLGGEVLGLDVDQDAIDEVEKQGNRHLRLVRTNFSHIFEVATKNGFEKVDGILFDFGVSSHQIDDPNRGFSFQHVSKLDMRMDTELGVTAKDLLNGLHKQELLEVFKRFGEERFAHGIASEIINRRKVGLVFETTDQLMEVIERVMPAKLDRIGAAARIFQALRILVNDELHVIEEALPQSLNLLKPGGRLVAISFHSLEDRIVKHAFQAFEKENKGKILTKHPVEANESEIALNPRSRSAKLRAIEKI